jgi:hypothetical protein
MDQKLSRCFNQTFDRQLDKQFRSCHRVRHRVNCQYSQNDQMQFILSSLSVEEQKAGEEHWRGLFWIWDRLLVIHRDRHCDQSTLICQRVEGELKILISKLGRVFTLTIKPDLKPLPLFRKPKNL